LAQYELSHVEDSEQLTHIEVILDSLRWKWAKMYRRRTVDLL